MKQSATLSSHTPPSSGACVFMAQKGEVLFTYPVIDSRLLIGRSDSNEVIIVSKVISRHHARIDCDESGYWITDLDSKNGTYLNGERLHQRHALGDQDRIRIGRHTLLFLLSGLEYFDCGTGGDDREPAILAGSTDAPAID